MVLVGKIKSAVKTPQSVDAPTSGCSLAAAPVKKFINAVTMRKILATLLLFLTTWCQADIIHGVVVAVVDGDTITVLDVARVQHRIRLDGIDAPEKRQAYGQRSKQSLSELVFNQAVEVHTYKRDRYGREIGKVLHNGQDVNLEQIRRGMAWFYRQYERELTKEDRMLYDASEASARLDRVGLWRDESPTPPWGFRHLKQ